MSDHDNQQHTSDSTGRKPAETGPDTSERNGSITEEALSQVLKKNPKESPEESIPARSDSEEKHSDGNPEEMQPDNSAHSEVDADDITLAEGVVSEEDPLPEDESQDPEPQTSNAGGDEVVTVTVNRLQELGELLKELNFREMIVRFGELQAELDGLRDGARKLRQLSEQAETGLEDCDPAEKDPEALLLRAVQSMESAAEQLNAVGSWAGEGRRNCVELASQVMDSLEGLKQSHAARLSMASDLSDMVESDATNEQLASAALEFAVFLREIDAAKDLEAFEIAFAELKALYDDMKKLPAEQDGGDSMVSDLKNAVADVRAAAGELSHLRRFHQQSSLILGDLILNGDGEANGTPATVSQPADETKESESEKSPETK